VVLATPNAGAVEVAVPKPKAGLLGWPKRLLA
jgi:hypothetical protein